MEFNCLCCSKVIRVKYSSQLKTCKNCGEVVCSSCRVKGGCMECANEPNKLIDDYFTDKYEVTSNGLFKTC